MVKKILCRVIRSAPLGAKGDISLCEDSPRIRFENISFPVIYTSRLDTIQLSIHEPSAGRIIDCYV